MFRDQEHTTGEELMEGELVNVSAQNESVTAFEPKALEQVPFMLI